MAIRALVMGFGGTGAHILTYVKEQAVLKYGAKPDTVRFLLFDTIADWRPGATVRIAGGAGEETTAKGTETSLDPAREYFFLGDRDPGLRQMVYELLAPGGFPERYPHLRDWLHTPWLRDNVERAQMDIVAGAAQQRQIGRFAMFQNAQKVADQIGQEVRQLAAEGRGAAVNVWLVGSSAGGTGAGCLLDAAHLTRVAVGNQPVSVTGVIVLPEVYDDKPGISSARAYSLFRELDRFQRQGVPDQDRYLVGRVNAASTVLYDANGNLRSAVPNKLFDNLFYVGSACLSDESRTAFFTSVASAVDPFLDDNAGPPLLEKSVNADAAASAFGAARLYVPKETLGELFAWQQVDRFLRAACAYVEEDGRRRLAAGSTAERHKDAVRKVRDLSPLFGRVLELDGTDEALGKFALTLKPQQIVEEWYGTAAPEVVGLDVKPDEAQDLRLTYAALPFSHAESEPAEVSAAQRLVRTRSEHKEAASELNLAKESAEASRDRFARELEQVMRRYKDPEAPASSFERGRRLLLAKLSAHLQDKVDQMAREALSQATRFAVDEGAPEQGTALTRLYEELRQMLADEGPFQRIKSRLALFVDAFQGQAEQREHLAVQAIQDLQKWKSRLLGGGVDAPQEAAREAVYDYLNVYQRDRLLTDMKDLVGEVGARVARWEQLLGQVFRELVLDPSDSCRARVDKEVKRLEQRLARLSRNPKARISADPEWSPERPGDDMLGYRHELEERTVLDQDGRPLSVGVLRQCSWSLEVAARNAPQLTLHGPFGAGEQGLGGLDLGRVHERLYDSFRESVDREIGATDVFDYLAWVERERGVQAQDLARVLREAARPLINAQGAETCHLVVASPQDRDKERWIDSLSVALQGSLGGGGLERVPHSDRDSITVFRILKPRNLADFINVVECRGHYLALQNQDVPSDEVQRRELRRAQVYHPFRPELEAWYIERRWRQLAGTSLDDRDHLSPRLAALLEHPAMMQAFVECVATGAVEKGSDLDWVWHNGAETLPLTVDGADEDLIKAAVVFVLQQKEGRPQGTRRIELEAARRSATEAAQARNVTVAQACEDFLASGLDALLAELRPVGEAERDRRGLRILFEFYGTRGMRTELKWRTDLQHTASTA